MADDEVKGAIPSPEPDNSISDIEKQSIVNELRGELLDQRAAYINRWLSVIAIVLTFFGIVVAIGGFVGLDIFRDIVNEAREIVKDARESAKEAKISAVEATKSAEKTKEILAKIEEQHTRAEILVGSIESKAIVPDPKFSTTDTTLSKEINEARDLEKKNVKQSVQKWREIAKRSEEKDKNLAARAWFSIGYLLARQRKHKEAIEAYTKALHLNRNFAEAYTNRGASKAAQGQYEDAIRDYNEALFHNPKDDKAYYNRGNARRKLSRYEDAILDYDEAIRLKPDNADAYNNQGIVKGRLGQHEAAIKDYNEVLRLRPDDEVAYYNRGVAKTALKQRDKAKKDFKKALNLARKADNKKLITMAEQELKKLDK